MEYAQQLVEDFVRTKLSDAWRWFDTLSRDEWLLVMGVCCVIGFLFLKKWGFGNA